MSNNSKPSIPDGTAYVDGDYVPLSEDHLPLLDWDKHDDPAWSSAVLDLLPDPEPRLKRV